MFKNLPKTLRRLMDESLRKQYKAGLINKSLELTRDGKEVLFSLLQEKFDAGLKAEAEEIIEEQED